MKKAKGGKRDSADEEVSELIKSRSMDAWVLLFAASVRSGMSSVVDVLFECPAGEQCQCPGHKRHQVKRGNRDDQEILEAGVEKIIEKHSECVREMKAPARNWLSDASESAQKKVKVQEEEKLLSDSEKLAKLQAERERVANDQAIEINPENMQNHFEDGCGPDGGEAGPWLLQGHPGGFSCLTSIQNKPQAARVRAHACMLAYTLPHVSAKVCVSRAKGGGAVGMRARACVCTRKRQSVPDSPEMA